MTLKKVPAILNYNDFQNKSGIISDVELIEVIPFLLNNLKNKQPIIKSFLTNFTECSNAYNIGISLLQCGVWEYNINENTIYISNEIFEIFNLDKEIEPNIEHFEKIFLPEERNKFIQQVEQIMIDKSPKEFISKIILDYEGHKNTKFFKFNIGLVKKNVDNYSLIGVLTDITDIRKKEDEIIRLKENAEASEKLKDVFLANLSHELRTPMNAILGFSELLNIGGLDSKKINEFISIIKGKSKYLLSMIDDIIEISKFETGEIILNRTDTNLIKVISELNSDIEREKVNLKKEHIDIYLSIPPDQKLSTIYTDSGRLHQVLSCIVDNALRYTEKGYIQFGYEFKDSKHLQFFVKDTGIGMTRETQKYVLNRFKYREETIDKKVNNAGLSLTISKYIIESLGGKIYIDSVIGQGTSFYFTLPILKTDKVEEVIEKPEDYIIGGNWKNKVILIAEDDEVNFKFIEAVLANTQVQLLHVIDGQQAVEICKSQINIDLILMDIKMPELNGYDAIKEIRKVRNNVPIIAQTAYTFKEEKNKCKEAGCDDYISKPIDIDILLKKIDTYFND